jgi:formate-dependent nitrite reductase membrane component NrfD
VVAPAVALAALAVTLLLLVFDLKRPDRFFYLLTKPNSSSWLVLGSHILMTYGIVAAMWLYFGLSGRLIPLPVRWLAALLGAASAGYSAFLFAQAKGRDLWQSPMFLWHLLVHAVIAGTAMLILAGAFGGGAPVLIPVLVHTLAIALALNLVMNLAEVALPHVNDEVRLAVREIVRGRFRLQYWLLAIVMGVVAPLVITALQWARTAPAALALAAVLALNGVWWLEDIWVKAGQVVPLS